MSDLLTHVLSAIGANQSFRPDLILASWPEVIGAKLAPMTEAVSFEKGVLLIKVKNSTLYSLLHKYERAKILNKLKAKFPNVDFKSILFRIG